MRWKGGPVTTYDPEWEAPNGDAIEISLPVERDLLVAFLAGDDTFAEEYEALLADQDPQHRYAETQEDEWRDERC